MIALAVAVALAVVAALTALIRRSRLRRAAFETALLDAVSRRLGDSLERTEHAVSRVGSSYRVPLRRLLKVAQRVSDVEATATAVAALLEQPLTPLAGQLSLKIHGARVGLHLVTPLVLELLAPEPRLARRPIAGLGLTATYRIDGRPDQCLSEDQLREQAIDTADLHGIALAVLRQQFDEALIERLLSRHREIVESSDGTAASALLVLSDFLPAGVKLKAALEGPDRLLLERWEATPAPVAEPGIALVVDDRGWKIL